MALQHTPIFDPLFSCPDFNLKSVENKDYARDDFFNGNPVVFMFICNHCPYVQAIEDRLVELGHDLKKLDINLVGICSNDPIAYPDDNLPALAKRAKEKEYPFVYLHDETQKIAKEFEAVYTPDFFIFKNDKKLCYRGRLDDSWKDASKVVHRELYEFVSALKTGSIPETEQHPSMGCSIKWSK